jgi:hypothetical protein
MTSENQPSCLSQPSKSIASRKHHPSSLNTIAMSSTIIANSDVEAQHNSVASDSDASVSTTSKQRISSARKRVIDETQLAPEEAERLQARRAYNRECATRARKRTKNLVAELQDEVKSLQTDKEDLRRENAVMKAQLEGLERQNQTLIFKQTLSNRQPFSVFGAMPGGFMYPGINLGDAFSGLQTSHVGMNEAALRAGLLPSTKP